MTSVPRVRLNRATQTRPGERTILLRDEAGAVTPPGRKARKREKRAVERALRSGFEEALLRHFRALEASEPERSREDLRESVLAHARAALTKYVAGTSRFPGPVETLIRSEANGRPAREVATARAKVVFRAEEEPQEKELALETPPTDVGDDAGRGGGALHEAVIHNHTPPNLPDGVTFATDFRVAPRDAARLRRYFPEVALFSPQIPPNTGTVARLCGALCTRLHLVEPLGFDVSEKAVRRAGLDYWDEVDVTVHGSLEALLAARPLSRLVLVETGGSVSPAQFPFEPGDLLLFGSETRGLPADFVADALAGHGPCAGRDVALVTIPMFSPRVRSINLANSVSMALFAAIERLRPRVEEAGARAPLPTSDPAAGGNAP